VPWLSFVLIARNRLTARCVCLEPVRQQSLGATDAGGVHHLHSIELAQHARRLLASVMTLHVLGVHDLASSGDVESALGTLMGFEFDLLSHVLPCPLSLQGQLSGGVAQ